ncbi:MAG: hydrogenase iron-sulfur subunit [Balneolaceae bacterium]|nr:hydrogenase iron-sulfur subunit [Balneolaceae bacterium]
MDTIKEEIDLVELAWKGSSSNSIADDYSAQLKDKRQDTVLRGNKLLRLADRWFHRLDRFVEESIPSALNPFTQSGAIANTTFIIALISGFIILIWYKPSVYQAYDSLQAIDPVGGFFRALHRYSSDACMLFILFHAFKMFFAGRFDKSRWLAWVTGIAAVFMLWFDGWLGYWLVWDERANQVAAGTAKILDQLPIFAEPLSRSFLTDTSFNSLLFFLVFFIHMLIPLAIGIALWMHVSRLNKANFITRKKMTIAVTASLAVLSIIAPADLTKPALMLEIQEAMPIDYFYMLPVYLTDRLGGGLLWMIFLITFVGFMSMPWVFTKKEISKPKVDPDKCNGCEQCYKDCPFNAITMFPRDEEDKKKGDFYASIDPSKCVSCGICVGACDPVGIEFPRLPANDIRKETDQWLNTHLNDGRKVHVAYVCSNSAGSDLHIDEQTGHCKELPGYLVRAIPCTGWVHPLMIERALRKGAEGVLVVGCQSEPDYRLGAMWTEKRITGKRHPRLREDKVDASHIEYLQYNRSDFDGFIKAARRFQRTSTRTVKPIAQAGGKAKKYFKAALILLILGSLTYFFSKGPYTVPIQNESELVVSFSLSGRSVEKAEVSASSQEDLLPHMRGQGVPIERERADVRLKVLVDGKEVLNRKYEPKGFFNDGNSGGLEYIPIKSGRHTVEIYLGDTTDDEWLYTDERIVEFEKHHRTVILFGKGDGFQWHPEQ